MLRHVKLSHDNAKALAYRLDVIRLKGIPDPKQTEHLLRQNSVNLQRMLVKRLSAFETWRRQGIGMRPARMRWGWSLGDSRLQARKAGSTQAARTAASRLGDEKQPWESNRHWTGTSGSDNCSIYRGEIETANAVTRLWPICDPSATHP